MKLDNIDLKILNENYDEELINSINANNVNIIYEYLINKGIYFAKDIFLSNIVLFLIPYDEFIRGFEKFIKIIGSNYVEVLEIDSSLLEKLYEL